MKKFLKILGGMIAVVGVAIIGFVVWVQARGIPKYRVPLEHVAAVHPTPARLALGEKIVASSCADCHLNRQTNTLSGHRLQDTPKNYGVLYSANITQDKVHGIGTWTDSELAAMIRTGIGRDGRYRVIMPNFVLMSDEDVNSVLAFLHSDNAWVKADPTPAPPQQPSFLLKALTNTVMKPTPLPATAEATPAPTDAVAYGRYLVVGRYKCYECHSKDFSTNNALEPEKSAGYLAGGNPMVGLQGQTVLSRNITADPQTGLGNWTSAQFAEAVKFGRSPGEVLRYPMPVFSVMSDEEANAIFSYLKTVPRIRNATPEDGAVATR